MGTPAAKREPGDRRPQSAGVGGVWAGVLVLALTALGCGACMDRWPGGPLTLQHPVQATRHLLNVLCRTWVRALPVPRRRELVSQPAPTLLSWPGPSPAPAQHPQRTEAALGTSADVDGMEGKVARAAAAVGGWVTDGAGQLWRHRMATPVLPGPQEGAAGCPARIIESLESPEWGTPFI